MKETQRVYQAVWQETDFVPEIDDHIDRESVYREFRQITDSTLTQSSVLGLLNESLAADAVIVAAAGSLPGIYNASGATGRRIPITSSTATHAWVMKSTPLGVKRRSRRARSIRWSAMVPS